MLYFLISALLVALDQGVKIWVRANLALGQRISFLPHIMDLTYTQNTGAAFSSFSGQTWLLTLISLGASIVLAAALARNALKGPLGHSCLTLLLAGAVGNLIDRALLGFVTDMFEVTFVHFAIFNVADICVTIGGALFVIYVVLRREEEPDDAPAADG